MSSDRKPLPALLSQILIACTIDFDRELAAAARELDPRASPPSLAMWMNVLRFVGEAGVEKSALPALSGISKPAIASMVACLERHGWIAVEPAAPSKRSGILRLTPRARRLSGLWQSAFDELESRWRERFGASTVDTLRETLETLTSQLGTELPYYPMAWPHRGGTPTGL